MGISATDDNDLDNGSDEVEDEGTTVESPFSLSSPPPGATFEFEEVKTDRGQRSLGKVPILTWNDDDAGIDAARAFYGSKGIGAFINGTSLKVTVQNIARKGKTAGLSDEQIAKKQLNFRPGTRATGASTPASRAAAAAKKAAEKFSGDGLAQLLAKMEDPAFRAQLASAGVDLSSLDKSEQTVEA